MAGAIDTAGAAVRIAAVTGTVGKAGFAVAAAVVAAPAILLRSLMFFANSAARAESSLAWRSLAIFSKFSLEVAAALSSDFKPPLDSVSLSGVTTAAFLSSTLASILPVTTRSVAFEAMAGAFSASLRLKLLKSLLCATMFWRASPADMAAASASVGKSKTVPAFKRLMLLPIKACGLPRSKATNI